MTTASQSSMTMTTNENDASTLLCKETFVGSNVIVNDSMPRALQTLPSNNKAPSKKAANIKKKKKSVKHSPKSLEDSLKEQNLCGCGKKMAAKCANQQCVKCCSGCPRHNKSKAAKSKAAKSKKQSIVVKNLEGKKTTVNSKKGVLVAENGVSTKQTSGAKSNVDSKEEVVVKSESEIPVETVDPTQEDDLEVVPIDIGGGHNDLLGSLIRAIASFPNFCPE